MKKKYLYYALFSMLGLTALAGSSWAHGFGWFRLGNLTSDQIASRQQTIFQQQADILGLSVDDVKNAWAEGKSLMSLAQEKGITQEQLQSKIKDLRLQQTKSQLQTLVKKGVITQAQSDKRLESMQNQSTNGKFGRRGMHKGFGFHDMGMLW